MTQAKRKQPVSKLEASQTRRKPRKKATALDRAGETAIEAKDRFTSFAREHPFVTIAGGLAIGVLVSGLFKRSPTRKLGAKAAGLAAIGAEVALAYAQQAAGAVGEAGRTGADSLERVGGRVGGAARTFGRDAADRAGGLSTEARIIARDAGKRIGQFVRSRAS